MKQLDICAASLRSVTALQQQHCKGAEQICANADLLAFQEGRLIQQVMQAEGARAKGRPQCFTQQTSFIFWLWRLLTSSDLF